MEVKFTDRARKVMQMANEEAIRFRHEYIGTEHILLALVAEGSGVAANALKNLDVDLGKVRRQVEMIVQRGPDELELMPMPATPRAKKVIEFAIEEARALNHNFVGTEDLLLGLLRESEGVAAQVLMNLGVRLNDAREEVCKLLGVPPPLAAIDLTKAASVQIEEPEPTDVVYPELKHLPTCARNIVDEFDCQINLIKADIEKAIEAQEWENAASLRDLGVKLKDLREKFIGRWPKSES
jgi:hypothetical protein